ncbi:MerR family transcriptional regulator [Rhodobacteraceae bacterium D3-12]|nr:MerR family transcriptional regulator [Rhodobacteraceae bacterium D3-12]
MAKSADAFRTISEVADWLGSPAHVLRFWESKFTQVKPVKRAGGRRYYRPADMLLLGGIKKLLHDDGMTIKGVQKVLREQGVKHVSGLSHPIDEDFDEAPFEADAIPEPTLQETAGDSAQVLQFQREESAPDTPAQLETEPEPQAEPDPENTISANESAPVDGAPAADTRVFEDFTADEDAMPLVADSKAEPEPEDEPEAEAEAEEPATKQQAIGADETSNPEPTPAPVPEPEFRSTPSEQQSDTEPTITPDAATLPAFLHRSTPAPDETTDTVTDSEPSSPEPIIEADAAASEPEPTPAEPQKPRPAIIELPDDPADDTIEAAPGLLATLAKRKGQTLPVDVLARVSAERDKLAAFVARQTGK